VLPAGAVFPFDFGFLPGTLGEDGDPLDVLLLIDSPTSVGCLVSARLIGVMEAEETEKGKTYRNDRLVAVAVESREHKDIHTLDQLSRELLADIEHFFVPYHQMDNKPFKPLGRADARKGKALITAGIELFRRSKK
jgi:inorganic pyrophosphatase